MLGESPAEDPIKIDTSEGDLDASRQDGGEEMDLVEEERAPYFFEPVQMAYAHDCDRGVACFFQAMLIDVEGRLACLTSEDYDVLPAQAGRYMVSVQELPLDFTGGCPVGEYLIEQPSHSCSHSSDTLLKSALVYGYTFNCLKHLEWDERGLTVRQDAARSGLISVRRDGGLCTFDFELIFEQLPNYKGSFSIALDMLPRAGETRCAM